MSSPSESEPRPQLARTAEENVAVLQRGLDQHGEAFLAYLVLDGVEQRSLTLVREFEAAFVGYWPDRASFVQSSTETLGWDDALNAFARNNGIWTDALDLNHQLVYAQLAGLYRITERLEGVYVFQR